MAVDGGIVAITGRRSTSLQRTPLPITAIWRSPLRLAGSADPPETPDPKIRASAFGKATDTMIPTVSFGPRGAVPGRARTSGVAATANFE